MYPTDIPNANRWQPCSVAPIPTLANLRDAILERSEKRFPKWKFRLAPDLILQIQPRAAIKTQFECVAVKVEGATAVVFTSPLHLLARDWWLAKIDIVVEPHDGWRLVPRGRRWRYEADRAGFINLHARVFEAFSGNRFAAITPDLMLSPNCLICGKGLTDPASMARFIGPECAGTSSLAVNRVVRLAEVQP
jgi:hypothetical protein